jgi:hypothetical protein
MFPIRGSRFTDRGASHGRISAIAVAAVVVACGPAPSAEEVGAIFTVSCSGSTCHTGYSGGPAEELDLAPEAMCADLVRVPSIQASGEIRLVPGDAGASYLLCKIDRDCDRRASGTALMPPGTLGLDGGDVDRIADWIAAGAPGCSEPDERAPAFAGASAAMGLASAIRVEWSPAADEATSAADIVYLVYEAEAPGAQDFSAPSHVSQPGATSVTAVPLPVSSTRYYVVRARDAAGNTDDNVVEVSATTLETADETPPSFAGVESATPSGSSSVILGWSAAIDDVSPPEAIRYRIYVATAPGDQDFAAPAVETEAGATEASVSGLAPETTYFFVVRAVDALLNEEDNTEERSSMTGGPVSFAADVQPIFDANCGGNACHAGLNPAEGLDLGAGVSHGELVGVPADQCGERLRVAPADPEASYLMDKLRGVDLCSGTRMPKSGPLPAAEIQIIADWIAQGAEDN